MKRIGWLVALMVFGCGDSEVAPSKDNNANTNGASNNHSNDTNGASNTGGATNNGSTAGATNGSTNTTGSSNTNGETNGETTLPPGTIRVQSTISPNQGPVGTTVTHTFTLLSNFALDPDIGGEHVVGSGHFHVYLDVVDEEHELLESASNPDTFDVELPGTELAPGPHTLILKVHKNDHSEYSTPLQYQIGFTITEE